MRLVRAPTLPTGRPPSERRQRQRAVLPTGRARWCGGAGRQGQRPQRRAEALGASPVATLCRNPTAHRLQRRIEAPGVLAQGAQRREAQTLEIRRVAGGSVCCGLFESLERARRGRFGQSPRNGEPQQGDLSRGPHRRNQVLGRRGAGRAGILRTARLDERADPLRGQRRDQVRCGGAWPEVVQPGQPLRGVIGGRGRVACAPRCRRRQEGQRRDRDLRVGPAHRGPRLRRAPGRLADGRRTVFERAPSQHRERVGAHLRRPVVAKRLDELPGDRGLALGCRQGRDLDPEPVSCGIIKQRRIASHELGQRVGRALAAVADRRPAVHQPAGGGHPGAVVRCPGGGDVLGDGGREVWPRPAHRDR